MKKELNDRERRISWRMVIAALLCGAMVTAGLAGCGSKETKEDTSEEAAQEEEAQEDGVEITEEEEVTDEENAEEGETGSVQIPEGEEVVVDEDGNVLSEEDLAYMDGDIIDGMPTPFMEYTDRDAFIEDSWIRVEELTKLPFTVKDTLYLLYTGAGMYEIRYSDEDGNEIAFRKSEGTEDNSGVYVTFEKEETVKVGDLDVQVSSEEGEVLLAVWTDGTYSYSIYADPGYTLEAMTEMIESVQ